MAETAPLVRTGPGTPAGLVLRKYWQPIALSSDILAGKAKKIKIMSEDFTLYRGETGDAHLVGAICPHRCTYLHTGWVEEDHIRCFYHGWLFDQEGQCIEQPAEPPGSNFSSKIKIPGYTTEEYCGLIFAYLGAGDPPPFPRYPELDRDYGVKYAQGQAWPCNYYQRLENNVDPSHVTFVHRDSYYQPYGMNQAPEIRAEETSYGILTTAIRDGSERATHYHMPNMLHFTSPRTNPWTDAFLWIVPIDDESSYSFSANCAPLTGEDAEQLEQKLAAQGVITNRSPEGGLDVPAGYNPADYHDELFSGKKIPANTNDQDYLAQVGQGPIADRIHEHLGVGDVGVILLRKLWKRELASVQDPVDETDTKQNKNSKTRAR